jgi:hypothetical protein
MASAITTIRYLQPPAANPRPEFFPGVSNVTFNYNRNARRITVTVPATYRPILRANFTVNVFAQDRFQHGRSWRREPYGDPTRIRWVLTGRVANGALQRTGSLYTTFIDINNDPIDEEFVAIPGHLDTFKLNNGLYADPAVKEDFIQLKNYLYTESIFDNMLNSLSEFFTSEGLKQGVTESIERLNKEFVEGKITIDQFNELVTKSEEELAGQYGTNYIKNYNAVKAAIDKYKYLLDE